MGILKGSSWNAAGMLWECYRDTAAMPQGSFGDSAGSLWGLKRLEFNRWPLRRPYLVDITIFNGPFQGPECFIEFRR